MKKNIYLTILFLLLVNNLYAGEGKIGGLLPFFVTLLTYPFYLISSIILLVYLHKDLKKTKEKNKYEHSKLVFKLLVAFNIIEPFLVFVYIVDDLYYFIILMLLNIGIVLDLVNKKKEKRLLLMLVPYIIPLVLVLMSFVEFVPSPSDIIVYTYPFYLFSSIVSLVYLYGETRKEEKSRYKYAMLMFRVLIISSIVEFVFVIFYWEKEFYYLLVPMVLNVLIIIALSYKKKKEGLLIFLLPYIVPLVFVLNLLFELFPSTYMFILYTYPFYLVSSIIILKHLAGEIKILGDSDEMNYRLLYKIIIILNVVEIFLLYFFIVNKSFYFVIPILFSIVVIIDFSYKKKQNKLLLILLLYVPIVLAFYYFFDML